MKPYSCNDRQMSKGYYAYERVYTSDGRYILHQIFIEHRMSTECKYDLSHVDARCQQCKHHKTES